MIAVLLLVALGAGLTLGTHWPKWAAYLDAEAAAELAEQEAAWRESALSRDDERARVERERAYWDDYGPVTFEQTWEAQPVAGAKRDVAVNSAWGGVLEVLNQAAISSTLEADTATVSLSGMGGAASVINGGGEVGAETAAHRGAPVEHDPEDPPYDPGDPGQRWWGCYLPFEVTVSAPGMPGDTDTAVVFVWAGDDFIYGWSPGLPDDANVVTSGVLQVTAAATLSNVYVRGYRQGLTVSGRQRMDATDFRGLEQWYANENSEVTVTATGPGGLSLSANGAYGSYASETALGINPFTVTAGFGINRFPTTEVLAEVSDITLGEVETRNAPSLWYAPTVTPGSTPSGVPANWSRLESDADAHKVRVDRNPALNIRRTGTILGSARSYGVTIRAAYEGSLIYSP
jgi:hypothetical protein